MNHYFIGVWGGVEPQLRGPFVSSPVRDRAAAEWMVGEGHDGEDTAFALDIDPVVKPACFAYRAGYMDDLRAEVLPGEEA